MYFYHFISIVNSAFDLIQLMECCMEFNSIKQVLNKKRKQKCNKIKKNLKTITGIDDGTYTIENMNYRCSQKAVINILYGIHNHHRFADVDE